MSIAVLLWLFPVTISKDSSLLCKYALCDIDIDILATFKIINAELIFYQLNHVQGLIKSYPNLCVVATNPIYTILRDGNTNKTYMITKQKICGAKFIYNAICNIKCTQICNYISYCKIPVQFGLDNFTLEIVETEELLFPLSAHSLTDACDDYYIGKIVPTYDINKISHKLELLYYIMRDILYAIHNLQINNIIHTQIKPSSIMITQKYGKITYKLSCFDSCIKLLDNCNLVPYEDNVISSNCNKNGAQYLESDVYCLGLSILSLFCGYDIFETLDLELYNVYFKSNDPREYMTSKKVPTELQNTLMLFFETGNDISAYNLICKIFNDSQQL
ncbi:hypothetical protein COBT_000292 [Conglomerata obtusa]